MLRQRSDQEGLLQQGQVVRDRLEGTPLHELALDLLKRDHLGGGRHTDAEDLPQEGRLSDRAERQEIPSDGRLHDRVPHVGRPAGPVLSQRQRAGVGAQADDDVHGLPRGDPEHLGHGRRRPVGEGEPPEAPRETFP